MVELGRSKKDQVLFNQFLRIPFEYFKFIWAMYPKSFAAAPYNLASIVTNYHSMLRRSMSVDIRNRKLIYGGIPTQYINTDHKVTGKKEVLDTLGSLTKNVQKLADSGVILYLNSPFETNAIIAGTQLCKQASNSNISWIMEAYPEVLRLVKDFDGNHFSKIDSMGSVDLLCLYMVGTEYPTDYTISHLRGLLEARKIAKKVTILCSHLTQEEFNERYGKGVSLCSLPLTDEDELNNFKALKRLVEA